MDYSEHKKSHGTHHIIWGTVSAGSFVMGVILTTLTLGYFLFVSKNARRNRDKVEAWVEKAQREVMNKVRMAKNMSREKYDKIVDSVADRYAGMRDVGRERADRFRDELKQYWRDVESEAKQIADQEGGSQRKQS